MTTAAAALSGDGAGNGQAGAVGAGNGAGDGAAAGGTGAAGQAGAGASAAANGEWYSTIPDEPTRTWAAAKGWKDANGAVESAYNLEKLIGFDKAGRTIVVPKDDASAEEVKAFHVKLGVPESADGYRLPVPEGMPGDFAKTAAGWFHEAGIPPKAAEKIAAKWNEHLAGFEKAQQTQRAQTSETEYGSLKVEWGPAFAQNEELGRRAARQFIPDKMTVNGTEMDRGGVLSKIEDAIGTSNMLKLFSSIGQGLGEHRVHQDGTGGGLVMTPAQARQRIEELKSNKEWTASYLNGDKAKKDEMTRLTQLGWPEPAA